MHVGRRSGGPASRRALQRVAGALALLLTVGSCNSSAPSEAAEGGAPGANDAADAELLELNREREVLEFLGGQTGDGTGALDDDLDGRESLDDSPCAEASSSEPLAQSDVVPELGFSADDVLAWASGGISSSLSWAPGGALVTAPETGSGSVRLRFEYEGGSIRRHTSALRATFEGRPTCDPWIEVDVNASLTTPGGALDERFPATLRTARARVVGFVGSIPAGEIAGSLELSPSPEPTASLDSTESLAGAELESLEIVGTLIDPGSYGSILASYRFPVMGDPPGLLERPRVAAWPAVGECPLGSPGAALPLGDDVTVIDRPVSDWKRAFADIGVIPMRWSDGAETRVALDIQAASPACFSTKWSLRDERLNYSVQLSALSNDRRWDAGYLGLALVQATDIPPATRGAVRVRANIPRDRAPSLGIALADAPDAESLELDLQLGRDLSANDTALGGGLRVTATRALDCSNLPPSETDACIAARTLEVAGAQLGASAGE